VRHHLRRLTLRQLLFAVLGLAAAAQVAAGLVLYRRLETQLEADLGRRLVHVSSLMSLAVDAPLVAQFREGDEDLPAYGLMRRRLAAQAEAAGVTGAYVLDRAHRTLLDSAADRPPGRTRYAALAHPRETAAAWEGDPRATRLYADDRGELRLSAFAPVRGGDGAVAALLGVDAPPAFFTALAVLRREMLLLGGAAVGLVALAGLWGMRRVDARLARLRALTTEATSAAGGAAGEARAEDQIGALGRDLDRLLANVVATRNHHEAVLGSLDVAVLGFDARGRATFANARAGDLLGERPPALVGRTADELFAGEGDLRAFVDSAGRGDTAPSGVEVSLRGGLAGGGRVLAASASRLVREGKTGGVLLSLLDVTELRRAERRARENERLAALGGMAGGLLHELGNPLAALTMYLDLLRGLAPEGEAAEIVARAQREEARLREFLEDFRVFAGLATPRIGSLELASLAAAVGGSLSWPAGVELATSGSGRVRGDARLLGHALRNLLRNALEAVPEGGHVAVEASVAGGEARLTVIDDGPGLSPRELERALEPFHTTKAHGTGLGLMIARRVAELHGGELLAQSRPRAGARFTLRWPARNDEEGGRTWPTS
jgi:two-component system sensor histidine kinase PilS (NtrC family)